MGGMDIYKTPEEAATAAKAEAEHANVTPQAVMYTSPEGYGSGAEDQGVPGQALLAAQDAQTPAQIAEPQSTPEPGPTPKQEAEAAEEREAEEPKAEEPRKGRRKSG